MSLKKFLTTHALWGKLMGAFLGYLIAGPAGALFGILIGNFFDRGLAQHLNRPHGDYHSEKRHAVQKVFFEATFSIMGNISKADGQVTRHAIDMAKQLMDELGLDRKQRALAQTYFTLGKNAYFKLEPLLIELRLVTHDNPALLKLFMDLQYRAALVNGLSQRKMDKLNLVFRTLGFAPIQEQYQFYQDFAEDVFYRKTGEQSHQKSGYRSSHSSLDHAYAILEITPNFNKNEVKKAYRRLISKNHPDKLIAQGLPEEMIKLATEKTQKIRKAYEQICVSKGW